MEMTELGVETLGRWRFLLSSVAQPYSHWTVATNSVRGSLMLPLRHVWDRGDSPGQGWNLVQGHKVGARGSGRLCIKSVTVERPRTARRGLQPSPAWPSGKGGPCSTLVPDGSGSSSASSLPFTGDRRPALVGISLHQVTLSPGTSYSSWLQVHIRLFTPGIFK